MKQIINIVVLISIAFINVSFTATQVTSDRDALPWFDKFGYNPCLNSTLQCSLSLGSMIQQYQERFHLKKTGTLDGPTRRHMNRPRCGIPDNAPPTSRVAATLKAAVELNLKWSRSSLTYAINSYPTQIHQTNVKYIIRDAFKAWTDQIPLDITEVCSACQPNFKIEFSSGDHYDNYAFDGFGGTLAHAFYPENGQIHFDRDEIWTESFTDGKTNLYLVAVHEIGHALGLGHVYDEKSIMYPSYQVMSKGDILPQPDRDAIQKIYGKNKPPTTPNIKPPRGHDRTPTGKSSPRCRTFLDTAFNHPDGTLHTIQKGVLWRYLPDEHKWEDTALTFSDEYPDFPMAEQIVAGVYNTQNKHVVLFTNTDAYHYSINDENQAEYPVVEHLPSDLQNSIRGAIYYHSEIYVITKKTLIVYDADNGYEISREGDLKEEFPGFRGTVSAAFTYEGLHHFFTTTGRVYVWDEGSNSWQTKDQRMERNWFACSDPKPNRSNDRLSSHRYGHRHSDNY